MRAAIYTRILKDLANLDLGVARQLADCHAYAAKQAYDVVFVFEDNDISASGLKRRPYYLKLQELMEQGSVDVVVYAMDRLERNMGELVDYVALSQKTTIGRPRYGRQIDLSTADGRRRRHRRPHRKFSRTETRGP
ncbi:recombinase family protein [Arthrobacter sp. Soil782]|uniref:recombinase family protein n=1 Tax=Arthrobacter sp. Soil782 TaxID=1736410 RepID=UPI003FA4AB0E